MMDIKHIKRDYTIGLREPDYLEIEGTLYNMVSIDGFYPDSDVYKYIADASRTVNTLQLDLLERRK